ncbi:MAG: ATP-binding protein [Saprospiraceae bacterium]|nr:ATP-binding protein [Saprospiraceae bacterium]
MTEQQTICPYTGLRSFTEEESLYFKGRDLQVDQITSLLEQNKFLMVTGASGEGKSSLIYAGLIPNARAGFFKAKYTNWVVADFRPERSPVHNMAEALAETFSNKTSTIETELRRGYSSLIDLYTNSDFYIDEADEHYQQLDEPQKKDKKRKAANLMIIVDQFEEFFTNPENFYNEAPSQDSQIVVNLVLETARIAIQKNIPVYIVCTMRSDYIGQCSAFRSLPEYIGFSQFFVPRLKRRDLKQVIEEPAILSGNRISQRLIERLVYDIADGVDQLPILQHALSQIWLAADHGQKEMDLVHYAMVGGMPAHELPDEEQPEFQNWFISLPEIRQKYFQHTGLNKVIEIHASVLYENAWEYHNKTYPYRTITQQDAKRIIALTFSCLTKIDNSRAVRNRMSLGEITGIINSPSITTEVVSEVLSIYREEGNSFIRPFKTEDPDTQKISPDTVLDITHESLIRNWNKLNSWANQEFEFYTTYLDFKKQLDRWKNSGKNSGFLLPIGPLTYFENWYIKCKPNVGWIKRYSEIQENETKATADAENVLADVREFIKSSADKVTITRAFMKYGPQKIATVVAIAAMIILSGFYWYDAEQKQNSRVIEKVRAEALSLMKSKEVGSNAKAVPLLIEERYKSGSIMAYLNVLDSKARLSLANETFKQLLLIDKKDTSALKVELKNLIWSNFKELLSKKTDYSFLMNELNKFTTLLAYDNYYNPLGNTEKMLQELVDESYAVVMVFLKSKSLFQSSISIELNYGIQQWLTFGKVTGENLKTLLDSFSPFEAAGGQAMFNVYYSKGSYEINGRIPNDFNGGHHTLASLYAALGDTAKIIQCFQAIRQSGQNEYFIGSLFNNYSNILAIFYQFGHREKIGNIVKWLGANYASNVPLTIYRNAVIRSGYLSHLYRVNIEKNILRSFKGYFFPNACLAKREVFNALADEYEKLIYEIKEPSLRHYTMAIQKKRRAIFDNKYQYDRGLKADLANHESLLKEAVDHFRLVNKDSLEVVIPIIQPYYSDGVRNRQFKRKHLFIYPDYMEGWFSWNYHSDLYFNFIDKNNLFEEFYTTPADLGMIHFWIAKANEHKPFIRGGGAFDNNYSLSDATLTRILALAETHPAGKSLDLNLISLILANRAFDRNDTLAGMKYYHRFNKENFTASRDKYEYLEKTFFLNQLKDLCVNLALKGKQQEAVELAEKFEQNHEKAFAYIFMAEKIYLKQTDPTAFIYLDSVFSKSKNIDFSQFNFGANQAIDYRFNLILLMSRIGGKPLNTLSNSFYSEIIEQNKFGAVLRKVHGIAEEGNFYRAKIAIPSTLTETEELIARSFIVWQACQKKKLEEGDIKWAAMDRFITHDFNYIFYIPN